MGLSEQNLENTVEELTEQIKATEIYKEYTKQKNVIQTYPELKEKTDALRELNFKLQRLPESDNLYDEGERLEQQYEELCEDTRVHDFMQAELDFCRLFQDILAKITSNIEFE